MFPAADSVTFGPLVAFEPGGDVVRRAESRCLEGLGGGLRTRTGPTQEQHRLTGLDALCGLCHEVDVGLAARERDPLHEACVAVEFVHIGSIGSLAGP